MTANATIGAPAAAILNRANQSVPELFERFYDWLTRAASYTLNGESRSLGLDESALVHEAYLRLSGFEDGFSSEFGFRAAARRTLERAAIDFLRRSRRVKRGGRRSPLPLDAASVIADVRDELAELELTDLLTRLHTANPRLAKIARRLLSGDTIPTIANELHVSGSTVRAGCTHIRAWLRSHGVS